MEKNNELSYQVRNLENERERYFREGPPAHHNVDKECANCAFMRANLQRVGNQEFLRVNGEKYSVVDIKRSTFIDYLWREMRTPCYLIIMINKSCS